MLEVVAVGVAGVAGGASVADLCLNLVCNDHGTAIAMMTLRLACTRTCGT